MPRPLVAPPATAPVQVHAPPAPAATVVPATPATHGSGYSQPAPASKQALAASAPPPQPDAGATRVERGDTLPARDHDTAVPLDSEPSPRSVSAQEAARTAPGGTWLDLPVAPASGKEFEDIPEEFDDLEEFRPRPAWRQIVDMIRNDAWSMFTVGFAVIFALLLILILLLKG
ncbi:MAG: hypothetical protein ABIO70_18775 [Pseudomonadota bacterium]